jgi:hypothetical protein
MRELNIAHAIHIVPDDGRGKGSALILEGLRTQSRTRTTFPPPSFLSPSKSRQPASRPPHIKCTAKKGCSITSSPPPSAWGRAATWITRLDTHDDNKSASPIPSLASLSLSLHTYLGRLVDGMRQLYVPAGHDCPPCDGVMVGK